MNTTYDEQTLSLAIRRLSIFLLSNANDKAIRYSL